MNKKSEKEYLDIFNPSKIKAGKIYKDEIKPTKDGYIYIHDMSGKRSNMNSCLFDMSEILEDGFSISNMWYSEPKSLQTAFTVIGDIIINATAMNYGGFELPNIDSVLKKYALKSYNYYFEEYVLIKGDDYSESDAKDYANKKVLRECEQGYQGIQYKLNSVSFSRGEFPYITFTFGKDDDSYAKMITNTILRVHKEITNKNDLMKLKYNN